MGTSTSRMNLDVFLISLKYMVSETCLKSLVFQLRCEANVPYFKFNIVHDDNIELNIPNRTSKPLYWTNWCWYCSTTHIQGQCKDCWSLSSLHRQVICCHGIDLVVAEWSSTQQRRPSVTHALSSQKGQRCKKFFFIPENLFFSKE